VRPGLGYKACESGDYQHNPWSLAYQLIGLKLIYQQMQHQDRKLMSWVVHGFILGCHQAEHAHQVIHPSNHTPPLAGRELPPCNTILLILLKL